MVSGPTLGDNLCTLSSSETFVMFVPATVSKVFGYLDLALLAEVAEAEGVDFRVLYLRRRAQDIVLADTVHRDFHK